MLERAQSAWADAIGAERVVTEPSRCAEAAACTFAISRDVQGILRPGSVAEVQACVRIANAHGVPLYAVSGGKNWGLGSRVPAADGCVLLDLARLNRIVDFRENLAYVTVEPGVTFRQAFDFLRERGSQLFLSSPGGPDTGSLIGNALERGDGDGPYGDRARHACAMEIVLPDGEIVSTGFARYGETPLAPLARWGVGPSLDGLFSQSNLGIVTRMTFWLAPLPEYFSTLGASVDNTAGLSAFIDALRGLVLREIVRPGCFGVWNAYKMLAFEGRYPWTVTKGETPLSLARLTKSKAEPWFVTGGVLGWSREHVAALSDPIRQSLSPHCVRFALSEPQAAWSGGERVFPWGIPDMRTVRSVYWRKKTDVPEDPDPNRDRCGAVWVCPALPFDGGQVASAMMEFEKVFAAHGFEPNIGMTAVSARSFNAYLAIMYDRDVPGEDARAMACHDELMKRTIERGYLPYRLGIQSLAAMPGGSASYVRLLRKLKKTLDPNDVIAPGRYDWRHEWPAGLDRSR